MKDLLPLRSHAPGGRRTEWSHVVLLLAALFLPAGPARAQIQVETTVVDRAEAQPLEVQDGAVALSLEEAIEIGLRQNLGLLVERFARTQARLGIQQNLGIYDLLANVDVQARDSNTPTGSALQASESNAQDADFSLLQTLPTGGEVGVGWNNSRLEIGGDFEFQSLNPEFNSGLGFSFAQPLLRDFGRLPTERGLRVAAINSQISRQDFELQAAATVQAIENAYWNLVESLDQLTVAEESLSLARELHERNRIQVEVGTLPPLDMVQSEARIAETDEGVIAAQAQVGDAADQLRRLLNLPTGELWEVEIRPETEPATEHIQVNVEEAIRTALDRRPELRGQRLDLERLNIESAFARNQERPRLDLNVSYSAAGTGGDLLVEDPVTGQPVLVSGGFNDAFSQLRGFGFNSWTARLVFAYPLQNRGARTQRTIAELGVQQGQARIDDLQSQIRTEVRAAARQLDTAAKQIEAARASRTLQEKNLEAERKRYENGMSTSFQITQIQEDLTLARSREVSAVTNYRRALTEYYRATGLLLEENRIELADGEEEVERFTLLDGLFGKGE